MKVGGYRLILDLAPEKSEKMENKYSHHSSIPTSHHLLFIMSDLPPEIIFRMGWFVPLWETIPSYNSDSGSYTFSPQDLIACLLVNRTWHRTLLPILWMVYDSRQNHAWSITEEEVFQAHSRHFRFLHIRRRRWPTAAPFPTRLQELVVAIYDDPGTIGDLTRLNPRLTYLRAYLPRAVSKNMLPILEPLFQLQKLDLTCIRGLTLDQLIVPLSHLQQLQVLELDDFENLDLGDESLSLPNLSITELAISSEWHRNPGLARVFRHCPSLETIRLRTIDKTSIWGCPVEELCSNWRQYCPNLKCLRNNGSSFYYSNITEDDLLMMLQSINRLVHLDLPFAEVSYHACRELIDLHAAWLETVHIYHIDISEDSFYGAKAILASCPNLRSFALVHQTVTPMPEDSLALFEEPWICQKLKKLRLNGFKTHDEQELRQRLANVLSNVQLERLDQEEEDGRRVFMPASPGGTEEMIRRDYSHARGDPEAETFDWTRILAEHAAPDPEFYNNLADHDWSIFRLAGVALDTDDAIRGTERISTRLEKIVQDKVFERVFALAEMREVTLGLIEFRKRISQ